MNRYVPRPWPTAYPNPYVQADDCALIHQLNWMGECVTHQPRMDSLNVNADSKVARQGDDGTAYADQSVFAIFGDDSTIFNAFGEQNSFDVQAFDRVLGFRPADFDADVLEGDLFLIDGKTYEVTEGPHYENRRVHALVGLDLKGDV